MHEYWLCRRGSLAILMLVMYIRIIRYIRDFSGVNRKLKLFNSLLAGP